MNLLDKIIFNITFFLIGSLFISCNDDLTAELPSYIEIRDFKYTGNNSINPPHPDGYNSTNITDVWVSMDGQIIGNFEMPCKIPILSEGNHSFDIYPGIKVNGISGARMKYPFYKKFEIDTILIKNEVISIEPNTSYIKDLPTPIFNTRGQFESQGTMFEKTNMSDTIVIIQSDVVFQGEKSAAVYLDDQNNYFEVRNIEPLELINNTFLELDFLSTVNFNVGLIIINPEQAEQKEELIQLYSTEEWKKIYLDLSPLINMGNSYSKFKIYFEGNYNEEEEENVIYLDNLKLIHP